MKFTARTIATLALPEGKSDTIFWDDDVPGFGLRIRQSGSRGWVYRYRFGNLQRSIKLGSATSVALALARENASKLEAQVRLGSDPAVKRELAKQEAENAFQLVAERFLDARRKELRAATIIEYERHLRRDAQSLHRLPMTAVTRADVARLLNNAPGSVTRNRLRATLCAMLTWALKEGIVLPHGNVAAFTNKAEEKSRNRALSDAELKAVWNALDDDDFGNILKLLILTGQREGEIGGLQWSEIRDDSIQLPPERAKNGRPHTIPLSAPAVAILDKQLKRHNRSHVFGRSDTGYYGWSFRKKGLDKKLSIAAWRIHDLRRTAVTGMAELGVQPHIIEAVINHTSGHKGGVAGVYNRASYDREKRAALNLWAEHVMALVEGARAATLVAMKRA